MALLWIDGFETYNTTLAANISTLLARRYATASGTFTVAAAAFGGLAVTATGSSYLQTPAISTNATMSVGFGCNLPCQAATTSIVQLYDGATLGIDVRWDSQTGELSVYRNGTLLGTTSGAHVTSGIWYYIELKVLCNASTGTIQVNVGGVTKLTLTGQNTKAGTDSFHDRVRFLFPAGNVSYTIIDNIYIDDGSGSFNTGLLGQCQVLFAGLPSGDSSVQWATSTGTTHYNLVNEVPPDDDTSWVQSATSGQADLFTYPPITGTVEAIYGVQISTIARVTDANTFSLIMPVVSGSESDGTSQVISSTAYADYRRIVETDPATSQLWTQAGINAATFGVKVQ